MTIANETPPPLPAPDSDGLIVVVGMGRSGIGAARLLQAQGRRVCVIESRHTASLEASATALRQQGIAVVLGMPLDPASLHHLGEPLAMVIVSPGIRWDHPLFEQLRQQGIPVHGELVPAWRSCRSVPWIGITGTNGKTTVTHLVSHLLQTAGVDAPMAGNVGHSVAERVLERQQGSHDLPDWLVVELSSYQIEAAAELAPRIGIWTTLTPDHLERHGTVDNYRAIKRSLLDRCGLRILNADDPDLHSHAANWDQATWVSAEGRSRLPAETEGALWIEAGRVLEHRHGAATDLMAADALAMPGAHNRQNMLLAAAAARAAGLSGEQLEQGLRSFPGVPHRLEHIRELDGVRFVNDSKATNYDAAEVALRALEPPLVVLAGGEAKQGEPAAWLRELARQARGVVLYGAAQQAFEQLLQGAQFPGTVACCPGLAEAVPRAAALARTLQCRTVLLSPACASFDQYSDFEARGEHFRQLVQQL